MEDELIVVCFILQVFGADARLSGHPGTRGSKSADCLHCEKSPAQSPRDVLDINWAAARSHANRFAVVVMPSVTNHHAEFDEYSTICRLRGG